MSNEIKNNKGAFIKEINGVKYFKLQSPYPGDYTKNCGLLGSEIDENFFFLRSYDIESALVNENNDIVLKRVDGEEIIIPVQEIGTPSFKLVKEKGELIVTYPDGTVQVLDGFLFEDYDVKVASDYTIKGDGRTSNPLRISEVEKTGTYAPADFFLDLTDSANTMPNGNKLGKGTRIVTKEYLTPFGLLYNYYGVEKIKEALEESCSKWRIPSRKDWAELLNAAEYCDEDRNHDTQEINIWTGNWAGARAKAINSWEFSDKKEKGFPVVGIDNLPVGGNASFHLIPLGYGEGSRGPINHDEDFDLEGLKLITSFWTSTPTGSQHSSKNPNVFTRSFSYETRKVLQESSKPTSRLSLRLVRDFGYEGYNEYENILGNNIPCVLISNPDLKYNKVWTAINIGFTEPQFSGVSSSDWDVLENEEDRKVKELYYINEWNGIKWIKKPMRPGDSIVILDYDGDISTSGDTYHEWRVYETSAGTVELIDTSEALKEEFQEEIDEINQKIDELSASTNEIKENLEDEINRATSAETLLAEAIDSIEVREVEPNNSLDTLKSYAVFVNDERRGVTIDIPKDEVQIFHEVKLGHSGATINPETGVITDGPYLDHEVLLVSYLNSEDIYKLVEIDLEDIIFENEFKDGLEVNEHVVKVKIDENSDIFLTVSSNGILLSGITSEFERLEEKINAETERAMSAETYIQEEVDELSASTIEEIERSNRIDDNIAKDIIGANGNSEEGYNIDFYNAIWTPVTEEEVESHPHTLVRIPEDYPEIPSASGWTGETYIEVFNSETSEHGFFKNVTSNNYISSANTVVDAIENLDGALRTESDRAKEKEQALQEKIDTEIERATSAETILQENIDTEVERATSAETYLSGAVDTLRTDTETSANTLNEKIDTEIERATSAEESISGNVTTLSGSVEEFSASTVSEISRLDAEDVRLNGQDIDEENNTASLVDGIILKRKNGEEEIKINVDTNFGLLPDYE